jgi:hypothetical protein
MAVAPPTAEASVPTSVMPIWTVARKVSGDSLSRMAAATLADGARMALRRLMRAETSAISEAAKKPFSRMPSSMRLSSSPIPMRLPVGGLEVSVAWASSARVIGCVAWPTSI